MTNVYNACDVLAQYLHDLTGTVELGRMVRPSVVCCSLIPPIKWMIESSGNRYQGTDAMYETHPKIKSGKIVFVHNYFLACQIILKYCAMHGSITAVLHGNFQNDSATEMNVMEQRDFPRIEIRTICGRISCIATDPRYFEWCGCYVSMWLRNCQFACVICGEDNRCADTYLKENWKLYLSKGESTSSFSELTPQY